MIGYFSHLVATRAMIHGMTCSQQGISPLELFLAAKASPTPVATDGSRCRAGPHTKQPEDNSVSWESHRFSRLRLTALERAALTDFSRLLQLAVAHRSSKRPWTWWARVSHSTASVRSSKRP